MNILSIIEHKVNHLALSKDEIQFFIQGYTDGRVPDYQMSSLLMAIKLNGMTAEETAHLTEAMVHSGETIDLSSIDGIKVDKHSTGGVGDKTSLVVGPIVASLGLKFAKMSGRGLGHTGGTIDKLESIPGLTTSLESDRFIQQVTDIGMANIGQTAKLVPADKKLYALRDVTGTVQSIPLIASSIMSKKIASGAQTILLDVKYGNGAYMTTIEEATNLANVMVDIGKALGRDTRAILSDMNQPLGMTIGNRLEVNEAIETLQGKGPKDFTQLCTDVSAVMSLQAQLFDTFDEAKEAVKQIISSGKAYQKFQAFISAQGGDLEAFADPKIHQSLHQINVLAPQSGFVHKVYALPLGQLSVALGAGRSTKEEVIDPKAGLRLYVKPGHEVKKDSILCTLYTDHLLDDKSWIKQAQDAFVIQPESKPIESSSLKVIE